MAVKHPPKKVVSPCLSMFNQWAKVNKMYDNVESKMIYKDRFELVMRITPSAVSCTYRVKLIYKVGFPPTAILLEPKIEQYNGENPHHIYGFDDDGNAILCVFHWKKDKWNSNQLIAETFIPWVTTWLNTYEYWLITGQWHYDEVKTDDITETK